MNRGYDVMGARGFKMAPAGALVRCLWDSHSFNWDIVFSFPSLPRLLSIPPPTQSVSCEYRVRLTFNILVYE